MKNHILVLFETFGAEASRAKLEGYAIGLEDQDPTIIIKAIRRAIKECKFLPRPAEIVELCKKIRLEDVEAEKNRKQRLALSEPKPSKEQVAMVREIVSKIVNDL